MTNVLTFKDLYTQVLTYLDKPTDTGQGLAMAKYAIQTAQEKRLTEDRWSFMLWPGTLTLAFQTGVRRYTLHPLTLMVTDFYNDTSGRVMKETPTRARYKVGVQQDKFHFEFTGNSPVKRQPATTSLVTVTGNARLVYTNANDDVVQEDVTSSTTSQAVKEIIQVTNLSTGLVVGVTLTDAAANQLLSLAVGEAGKNYPQIQLFGDPASAESAHYRFYRKPGNLVHDNDIPDIPYPFSRILVYDALLELATYSDGPAPQYWIMQQSTLDMQMRQTYQEGEMEGSESRQVQEVDTYGG